MRKLSLVLITALLSACTVGPDYHPPAVNIPTKFKEAPKGWKVAQPRDDHVRGDWWRVFKDPQLNALEERMKVINYTVAAAEANFRQAMYLVDEARASYFPTLVGSANLTRQKVGSSGGTSSNALLANSTSGAGDGTGASTIATATGGSNSRVSTFHSILLTGSWEPDIWGAVRRGVEASVAGAQSTAALLGSTRLAAQASLAQYYFELRGLDRDQEILNATVVNYQKSLKLTRNQYAAGVVAQSDIVLAQSQLLTAQAQAINNGILRAQYEHAIAVLIGEPPAYFKLAYHPLRAKPPAIPIAIPTIWLERRPDIAQAERLMAQANAQIGVTIAAFYPTLTLSASASYSHPNYSNWFSLPGLGWSLGPQLAQTFLDGGLRTATVAAARAGYESTAATYKQTILAAFQDVEDNLVALRILNSQAQVENDAVKAAKEALKLMMNQYAAGTVAYANVITAQTTAFTAEKTAADVNSLRMTAAVGLIKALGGGWDVRALD